MSDKTYTIHPIKPDPHPNRPLGLGALIAIAIGNVFSASVYSLQAPASGLTGRSAWLANGVAVIIGFLTVLPYLLVSGAVAFKGGDFTLVQLGLGKRFSGLFAWYFILMCIGPAISVSAIGGYFTTIWPNAPGTLIAIGVVVLIFILNIMPIKAVSKVQNYMFYVLCAATLVYIVYGLFHLNPDAFNFKSENYFSGGMKGFITASTTFTATTAFYVQTYALAPMCKNPRSHMPKAMTITAIVILFLYPLMTLINVNTLPWEATVGKTMVGTAQALLPKALFIFFVICGPFLSVTTTLNAGFMALARPFEAAADIGWLPRIITKKNKHGAPVGTMCVLLFMSVVPVLVFKNILTLANATILIQNIIKIVCLIAAWRIPSLFPELWKTGLFRKMPLAVYYIIVGICTAVQLYLVVTACMSLAAWQIWVSIGLLALMTIVALIWFAKKGKEVNTEIDYESMS